MIDIFKRKTKKIYSNNSNRVADEIVEYIVTLNNKDFNKFINKYYLSIVDFWAPWCAPCREMGPRFRRLSKIYKEKAAFGKLDTQKYPEIAKKYKILTIPHIVFFSFGKKISSLSGLRSIGDLKNEIDTCYKKVGKGKK
jgi:thioredoxin 1